MPVQGRRDSQRQRPPLCAFFGLSKLSAWWLRLGIDIERIKPGKNFLQQQALFDRSIHDYNQERPHQGLRMKYPAELYRPSP